MPKVLLANHYEEPAFKLLESLLPSEFSLSQLDAEDVQELKNKIVDCDYLIASGRLKLDREVLSCGQNLRMIARTGVGLDSIDLEALEELSLPLYVSEGVNAESVAEHTILLMLAALRNFEEVASSTKSGEWLKRTWGLKARELAGKKVFIAGLGNIGRKVLQLLSPFGCEVDGSNRLNKSSLPKGMLEADIVSLHCPLTNETKHLLDAETIAQLKPGCIVINTARGGLIDEAALMDALRSGQIGYACLDVREEEPPSPLALSHELNNVILTPHVGGITNESFTRMLNNAVECIVAFDKGDLASIDSRRVSLFK